MEIHCHLFFRFDDKEKQTLISDMLLKCCYTGNDFIDDSNEWIRLLKNTLKPFNKKVINIGKLITSMPYYDIQCSSVNNVEGFSVIHFGPCGFEVYQRYMFLLHCLNATFIRAYWSDDEGTQSFCRIIDDILVEKFVNDSCSKEQYLNYRKWWYEGQDNWSYNNFPIGDTKEQDYTYVDKYEEDKVIQWVYKNNSIIEKKQKATISLANATFSYNEKQICNIGKLSQDKASQIKKQILELINQYEKLTSDIERFKFFIENIAFFGIYYGPQEITGFKINSIFLEEKSNCYVICPFEYSFDNLENLDRENDGLYHLISAFVSMMDSKTFVAHLNKLKHYKYKYELYYNALKKQLTKYHKTDIDIDIDIDIDKITSSDPYEGIYLIFKEVVISFELFKEIEGILFFSTDNIYELLQIDHFGI